MARTDPETDSVTLTFKILAYFDHAKRRDREKGGGGYRTTRNMADQFGWSVGRARYWLNKLYQEDAIDGYSDGTWRGKASIHDEIEDQVGLAQTYARDGAFYSAAEIFRKLSVTVQAHALATDPSTLCESTSTRRTKNG